MRIKTALQLGTLCIIAFAIMVSIILAAVMRASDTTAAKWYTVLLLTVVVGIVSLIMAYALHAIGASLSTRISRLEDGIRGATRGDLDAIAPLAGQDEVSEISEVFAEMSQAVRDYVQLIPAHDKLKHELQNLKDALDSLRRKNMDVSDSLQRLRRAQGQLLHRERLSLLGRMFESASQDIHAAVGLIQATTDKALAAGGPIDPDTRLSFEAIAKAARQARRHLEHFSSLVPLPGQQRSELLDLRDVVKEAFRLTETRWQSEPASRGIPISIQQDMPSPLPVKGSRTELVQLFVHLIHNAVDAMPRGGTITVHAAPSASSNVAVSFSDNGAGMSETTLNRCLKPFFSTKDGAAGIGLSLAHAIVTQHRGRIGLESHPGSGTTVFVELPMASSQAEPVRMVLKAQPPALTAPLRVLVAEDDAWTRDILTSHLKADGHSVDLAENATQALLKLGSSAYDLVITDRAMPDMSGDELAREIKRNNPAMPVILLTGFGALMKERGETPDGVDLVQGKPISAEELRQALAQLIATNPV